MTEIFDENKLLDLLKKEHNKEAEEIYETFFADIDPEEAKKEMEENELEYAYQKLMGRVKYTEPVSPYLSKSINKTRSIRKKYEYLYYGLKKKSGFAMVIILFILLAAMIFQADKQNFAEIIYIAIH